MPTPSRACSPTKRLKSWSTFLLGALGAMTLVVAVPASAHADVLQLLPQNADGLEQTFSPAYDYDGDGCYATAAIGADGTINPGLPLGGDVNGHCHDYANWPTPTPTHARSATTAGAR